MKHVVRVLIAVLIVGLVGYLVYFFAFKPDPDISSFNSLAKLQDEQDRINIEDKLKSVRSNASQISDSDTNVIIENMVNTSGTANSSSQLAMYGMLDEAFNYYFGYTSFAKNVKSSMQKSVNKAIKNYRNALNDFAGKLDQATAYQRDVYIVDSNKSNVSIQNELNRFYQIAYDQFVQLNKNYYNLDNQIFSLIQTNVFGGQLIADSKSCELDMIQQSVNVTLNNIGNDNFAGYAKSMNTFWRVYRNLLEDNLSDAEIQIHANILKYYTTINAEYNANGTSYLTVFVQLTHEDKVKVKNDDASTLSQFPEKLRSDVRELARLYGFAN